MKLTIKSRALTALLVAAIYPTAHATTVFDYNEKTEPPKEPTHMRMDRESRIYYKIGGLVPISEPPSQSAEIKLGFSAVWNPGYSCGKFDPTDTLNNFFENTKKQVEDAIKMTEYAVNSAVAALPLLILQRNMPGLYELLQGNILRFEETFRFSVMSCQEMERQIAKDQNPYKRYMEYAQSVSLQEEAMSNPNAVDAMEKVAKGGGDSGFYIPVPDKGIIKAGGKNQEPIKPITSTAVVGYNMMVGRSDITNTGELKGSDSKYSNGTLSNHFPTPKALAEWLATVVGEDDIYTTNSPSQSPQSIAATGLIFTAHQSQIRVERQLQDIKQIIDIEEQRQVLLKWSKGGAVDITPSLLSRISDLGPAVEGMFIKNLAGELALASSIEKAQIARRVLLVGLSEPNISMVKPVQDDVLSKIRMLEKDIEQLVFEYRLKKELVSGLANIAYNEEMSKLKQNVREKGQSIPDFKVKE